MDSPEFNELYFNLYKRFPDRVDEFINQLMEVYRKFPVRPLKQELHKLKVQSQLRYPNGIIYDPEDNLPIVVFIYPLMVECKL